MSDVDPLDALEAETTDPDALELLRVMRVALAKHEREQADETTDEDGNPLPRLDLDATTAPGDPLLRVAYTLLGHLPDGWRYAILSASAAADDVRTSVTVKLEGDGPLTMRHLLYLPDVAAACAEQRRSRYEDGHDAWYSATFLLRRSGVVSTFYPDHPPFGVWARTTRRSWSATRSCTPARRSGCPPSTPAARLRRRDRDGFRRRPGQPGTPGVGLGERVDADLVGRRRGQAGDVQ